MKIVETFPPNYDLIQIVFPNCEKHEAIFCYGDTIHNPFKVEVRSDLEHHESIHQKQQGDNPDLWWSKYLQDEQFRLEQEKEAYGEQLLFSKKLDGVNRNMYDWLKEKIAESLSSELYGNLISYQEAERFLRCYVKENS